MKTIPWGMATCLFHKFSCLKSKFVPLKTQKSEKNYDFSIFLICNFSLFIFFLHFVYSLLRTNKKCFLWSGNMFFSEVFMSWVKISYRTKHQKTWKINDFSNFLVCNFSLFIFFSTFLYSLLITDEKCFLRSGNMFFSEVFMPKVKISVQNIKKHENSRFFDFLIFNFSLFDFFFYIS